MHKDVNFIIEVKRPGDISPIDFAKMVIDSMDKLDTGKDTGYDLFVFDTAGDVLNSDKVVASLQSVKFVNCEVDTYNDTFYIALKIPSDATNMFFINNGKGRLFPKIMKNHDNQNRIVSYDYVRYGGQ
mgnify:CR=1 FL=1